MNDPSSNKPGAAQAGPGWTKLWPVAALIAALGAAWASGLFDLVSFASLARHRGTLTGLVAERPFVAALLYAAAYVGAVSLSIPAGRVLTMASGFLVGRWFGAVPAATAGACALFLAVRSAVTPVVAKRAGPFMEKLRPGLERDGFRYLLPLRLLPMGPTPSGASRRPWSGCPWRPSPASPRSASCRARSASPASAPGSARCSPEASGRPDASAVLQPPVLLPLLGLAALSLAAMRFRQRRSDA